MDLKQSVDQMGEVNGGVPVFIASGLQPLPQRGLFSGIESQDTGSDPVHVPIEGVHYGWLGRELCGREVRYAGVRMGIVLNIALGESSHGKARMGPKLRKGGGVVEAIHIEL